MPDQTVGVALDDDPAATGSPGAGVQDPTEVVALTGGVDLATCPGCDAVNAVQRPRCARCGAVLHPSAEDDGGSDDAIPLPSEPLAPGQPGRRPSSPDGTTGTAGGSRRIGLAVVAVGAVVGAVLASWLFGVGPFARTPGPGVLFDGEVYEGQASPLRPASLSTTPVRDARDGRAFTADLVVDGRLETAWVTVEGDDAILVFEFARPVWITAVEVANGDQYDDEAFDATARVRTLGVDAGFGAAVEATLISGTGRQGFRPPVPLLTDTITLDVLARTEGQDVALSEVSFIGFTASPADAAAYAAAG